MPREILVDWTTINGSGKVSVFNFIEASSVATQRSALNTFLTVVASKQTNPTKYTIRNAGREWNTATGELIGAWTDAPTYTGVGLITGNEVADATQLLVQWQTGHVVNGRFLHGRQYFPGMASAQEVGGNVQGSTITTIGPAAQALCNAGVQLCVWHRPQLPAGTPPGNPDGVPRAGGVAWAAQVGQVWTEWAVLRRRRH